MDNVGASIEVLHLISTTLVFIHHVIIDDKKQIESSRTVGSFVGFLDAFSDICFGNVTGLLRDARVHQALTCDVERSLYSMSNTVAAQREAWRTTSIDSCKEPLGIEDLTSLSLEEKSERRRLRNGMRERSQIWKEKVRPGLYEALFGQEEMENLVSTCGNWINRLQQTLEVVLLTVGPPHTALSKSHLAIELGVVNILERQSRAFRGHSGTYNALPGKLRDTINSAQVAKSITKTLYIDESEEVDVMVETRSDTEMSTDSLCQLTWLLQAPTQNTHSRGTLGYRLSMLNCMGFIDDPINKRGLILYRSPQSHPWSSSPPSLHALITKGPGSKLSLTGRFRTATDLATTVLEAHASGWLHRRLCSRSFLMLPQSLNDSEPSPFLVGLGVPQRPETGVFGLDQNLYQHEDQFGKPTCEYANLHDIYSLGVILLELGLWKTTSTMFARRLGQSPQSTATQQQNVFKAINKVLIESADSPGLKREMGERYAAIVLKCLTWQYRDPVEGMIEFRRQVVDTLAMGLLI